MPGTEEARKCEKRLIDAMVFRNPRPGWLQPGNASVLGRAIPYGEVSFRLSHSYPTLAERFAEFLVSAFREQMGGSVFTVHGELASSVPVTLSGGVEESLEGEVLFRNQAIHNPDALVRFLVKGTSSDAQLAFAAEAAGGMEDSAKAVEALLQLLDHGSSVVREGVVGGLAPHLERSERARNRLKLVVSNDLSAAVRQAAAEALRNA